MKKEIEAYNREIEKLTQMGITKPTNTNYPEVFNVEFIATNKSEENIKRSEEKTWKRYVKGVD